MEPPRDLYHLEFQRSRDRSEPRHLRQPLSALEAGYLDLSNGYRMAITQRPSGRTGCKLSLVHLGPKALALDPFTYARKVTHLPGDYAGNGICSSRVIYLHARAVICMTGHVRERTTESTSLVATRMPRVDGRRGIDPGWVRIAPRARHGPKGAISSHGDLEILRRAQRISRAPSSFRACPPGTRAIGSSRIPG